MKTTAARSREEIAVPVVSVSVVVPCRNEICSIRVFLDSVLQQDVAGMNSEVLIADGMSDDGTRAILKEYERKFPALRVIDNHARIVSTALNAAIREARGEIIVRMDAHSVYAPDYIRRCIEVLNETNAENVGGPALTRADGFMVRAIAHAYQSRFARGGAKSRDLQYQGPADTVPYGCWRKSTLERLGLFDENFVRTEDYELNLRITSSGGTIWQSPKIVSWYCPRASLSRLFRQYFQYGFWKTAVIRKHRGRVSLRNLVPGTCLIVAILLLLAAAGANLGGLVAWRNVFLCSWAALAVLYFAASASASFVTAKGYGWKFLPIFPIVFATYHLSFGLGSILALSCRPATRDRPSSMQKILTEITR